MPTQPPLAIVLMIAILWSILGAWIWVILRLVFGLPVLPPSTPRIVPWGGRSVLAVVVFWIALNLAVPTAYRSFTTYRALAGPGAVMPRARINAPSDARIDLKPAEMMSLSAVQNASTLALIPLLLWATCRARPRDFGLTDPAPVSQAARGLLAYPLLAPIVFGMMGLSLLIWGRTSHPLEEAIGEDRPPGMGLILVLAGVVLAPMAEELIFRGILLGWLTRVALVPSPTDGASMFESAEPVPVLVEATPHLLETIEIESPGEPSAPLPLDTAEQIYNPYTAPNASIAGPATPAEAALVGRPLPLLAANLVVSLVFASLHGAVWPTPIPIFFLSLGLGFLYQRTGGLLAPIALHMTFNGVSTTLMFLSLGNNPAPNPGKKAVDPVPPPTSTTRVEIRHRAWNLTPRLIDATRGF